MNFSVFAGTPVERTQFIALLAFLTLCLLGGGASRPDVWSLLYLRPAAILAIALFVLLAGARGGGGSIRFLFLLLAALAATIAIQLVPLPAGWALALPGRETYRALAESAGLAGDWRPISLTPDLTWNSLLALLPATAALLGLAAVREDQRQFMLPYLLGAAILSAGLGIVQLGSGAGGPAYLYAVTTYGVPVGLFANRNHHAVFLAAALPMLRAWTLLADTRQTQKFRQWIAAAVGLFLIGMILVTGSRAGTVLALIAIIAAFSLDFGRRRRRDGLRRYLRLALWMAPFAIITIFLVLGRGVALERFAAAGEQSGDLRFENLPVVVRIISAFFPFGSGFGSFDPVFRGFETDQSLSPFYFNHAHNDVLELLLTGGLPAALVALVFAGWWAINAAMVYKPSAPMTHRLVLGRTGAVTVALLLAASILDYPLRTPLLGCLLVIACVWLAEARRQSSIRSFAELTEPVQ